MVYRGREETNDGERQRERKAKTSRGGRGVERRTKRQDKQRWRKARTERGGH